MQDITPTVKDGALQIPLNKLQNKVKEIKITAEKVPENTPGYDVGVKKCLEGK